MPRTSQIPHNARPLLAKDIPRKYSSSSPDSSLPTTRERRPTCRLTPEPHTTEQHQLNVAGGTGEEEQHTSYSTPTGQRAQDRHITAPCWDLPPSVDQLPPPPQTITTNVCCNCWFGDIFFNIRIGFFLTSHTMKVLQNVLKQKMSFKPGFFKIRYVEKYTTIKHCGSQQTEIQPQFVAFTQNVVQFHLKTGKILYLWNCHNYNKTILRITIMSRKTIETPSRSHFYQ